MTIREARENRCWTQADLAGEARVSVRTIVYIESGKPCRMETKRRICEALGFPWERREELFPR